jgi:phage gp36-like protein
MPSAPHIYVTISDMLDAMGDRLYTCLGEAKASNLESNRALAIVLESVNDEINSYLRKRYTLPLTTIPAGVRMKAVALARYAILSNNSKQNITEADTDAKEDAIDYLEKIADGDIALTFEPENRFELLGTARRPELGGSATATSNQSLQNKGFFRAF